MVALLDVLFFTCPLDHGRPQIAELLEKVSASEKATKAEAAKVAQLNEQNAKFESDVAVEREKVTTEQEGANNLRNLLDQREKEYAELEVKLDLAILCFGNWLMQNFFF